MAHGLAKASEKSVGAIAAFVAFVCFLPMLAVVLAALTGSAETLLHLVETVLPLYTVNTLILVVLVALGSFAIGVGAAWLVVTCEFPGRRVFEILLVIPLAFPAYVLAYAYTHILDHPGIVQSSLRDLMGWGPRDYWFPEIRSLPGAALMLTFVLYPYVYLLTRAAFMGQSASAFLAARTLGNTAWQSFCRTSLPMARPAISAGLLLVAMETLADFGTVAHFAVPTLATGIYNSWFSLADRAAAAQLALVLLTFAIVLASLERANRGSARYASGRKQEQMARTQLTGRHAWFAVVLCFLPVLFGAIIPTVSLGIMAQGSEQNLLSSRYLGFIQNSLTLAGLAAVITVFAAVILGSFHRFSSKRLALWAIQLGRIGYAVPGGVIAVGLLVPLAAFDNALDTWMRDTFDVSTGLLLTGSIWVLVAAYMVRFLAAAIGAYESGVANISSNMDAAARVLGQGVWGTMRRVHLPIMRPALMTAALLVFVDVMKELPATLIMRPFNFDTLAVQAYRLASDERLEGAAVPSLVIAGIGLIPVILLCRRMAKGAD